jgi:hypothetical protein
MFTKQNYLSNTELLKFLRLNRAFNTKRDSSLDMGINSGGTLDELSLMLTKTIIGGNEYLDYLYPKFVTASDWLSEEDVKKGMKLAIYKKEDVLEMAKMLWKAPKGIDANLEEEV